MNAINQILSGPVIRYIKNKKGLLITAILIAGSVIIAITGCDVYSHISAVADDSVDFSKYRTFAWLPDKTDTSSQPYNNEIIRNNIRNYFGQSFAQRGYKVHLDTPDVLLQIVIANKKKQDVVVSPSYPYAYPYVYPAPYYYHRYYYGSPYHFPYSYNYYYRYHPVYVYPPSYNTQMVNYVEGSITLNVFDRKKNKLVWTGTAKGDIYDPAYINQSIHPAVEAIMRRYPVRLITKLTEAESQLILK